MTPEKDVLPTVAAFIENTLEDWAVPMKCASKVQIAVDEIFSNIVYYSGAKAARLAVAADDEALTLLFEDDGKPYDPMTAKEPDITLPVEEREIGGLGIFMVRKMAADVQYENSDGKNRLTVVLNLK